MAINQRLISYATAAAETPAAAIKPSEHFETVLYTGNGSTNNIEGGWIGKGASFTQSSVHTVDVNFDLGQTFSFSCWVKFDNVNSYQPIITRYGGTNATNAFILALNNDAKLQLATYDGSGTSNSEKTTETYSADTWYHIVVVINGTSQKVYVDKDADIDATATFSINSSPTSDIVFGNRDDGLTGTNTFGGDLDHVRFFNKALSTANISTLYDENAENTSGFTTDIFGDGSGVALYEFEGTGSTLNAKATNAGTGNFKGTAALKNEGAAFFDGSGDRISISATATTPVDFSSENHSISFWINMNSFSPDDVFVAKWGNSNALKSFYLGLQGTGNEDKLIIYERQGSGNNQHASSTVLSTNTWQHIVYVRNGTQVILYVDNSAETFSESGTINTGTTQNIDIGGLVNFSSYTIDGRIKDVRFYSDAITSTEVGYLYNNTTAYIDAMDNLVAYYKLNGNALDETGDYDGTASGVKYGYDGTNSDASPTSQLNFSPDFVWVKNRDGTAAHGLFDTVRGALKELYPNLSAAEGDGTNSLSSFDDNGFTVGSSTGFNGNSDTLVAWCLKAGGTATTITSECTGVSSATRSANTTAGFSIVEATANAASQDLAHGLDSTPELHITKRASSSSNWTVYNTVVSSKGRGFLNLTNAFDNTGVPTFDSTEVSGLEWASGDRSINYFFHSVTGFSKVGSYNLTKTSNKIETGFEVAWVMIKRTDNTGDWYIFDNKRNATNPRNTYLLANSSGLEPSSTSGYDIIFASDGFVHEVTTADSTINYIYLAFAAEPDTTTPTESKSFDIALYEGNSGSKTISGMRFKPDLLWIKNRDDNTRDHQLWDVVRGGTNFIESSDDAVEFTNSTFVGTTEDGFELNGNSGVLNDPESIVAWAWKAGDHDNDNPQVALASGNDHTIDTVQSVNDEAGFSICKYTGTGTQGDSFAHGLSGAPDFVAIKRLTTLDRDWIVYHSGLSGTKFGYLNLDLAFVSLSSVIPSAPTATVFTLGSNNYVNGDGEEFIAYCWRSISGYSDFGTWDGGTGLKTIDIGFRPDLVIIKGENASSNWFMYDSERGDSKYLLANDNDADANDWIDFEFNDDGFQVNEASANSNISNSVKYMYHAWKIN